ncbi:HD domain-containing protein [Candidatus Micrarchaeota archaeon]|nr:HD domain-containing protein [Candidatus Micrarchaeota archaeon]
MIIRDAIHGGIEFNASEEGIIASPLMQRLRHVRQLSMVALVYPSATHTRFEHSLGSTHLTGVLAERLGLKDGKKQAVRLASLLHDVGHGAFSHSSDLILLKHTGKTHEERGLDLVKESGLAETIPSFDEVRECLKGKNSGALLMSELGTDRMDYLLRDAYFTGVSYSAMDHRRLLETLALKDGELVVLEKGVVAAESLLVSRHLMFNAVYLHPAVRICEAMVEKMLEQALEEKLLTLEKISFGTDDVLLTLLATKNALAERLLDRRLYKKAFVLETTKATEKQKEFLQQKEAEQRINSALEETGEFVVCMPPERKKYTGIKVLAKDGELKNLEDYSNLVKALNLESGRDALIVACPEEKRENARKSMEGLFG